MVSFKAYYRSFFGPPIFIESFCMLMLDSIRGFQKRDKANSLDNHNNYDNADYYLLHLYPLCW